MDQLGRDFLLYPEGISFRIKAAADAAATNVSLIVTVQRRGANSA